MRLGELIRLWRNVEGIGIRDLAKEIGTSPATLSRIERGEEMDGKTLVALLRWLTSPPTNL